MEEKYFSKAARNYPPSGIRKMFDLAAQYPDAIKLTVGEPNFDTPAYIKEAAKKAMDAGETHYTPNAGMTVLRQAVAEKYQKAYWGGYTADHVMVTVGAMEGLMLTMMLLLDPGDEILVPDPCFPNYYGQASLTGACAKPVPTYEDNDYRMMAADIEKCITPHTKALLLNSPCNPTGAVLTREDVLAIAEVVKKHDLWVLSDEPYDSIVYDGVTPFSITQVPEVRDRVFVLNSFSKSYAMTGWRVGFLAAHPDLIKKISSMQGHSTSSICSVSQKAALAALEGPVECVGEMRAAFLRRRDLALDIIKAWPWAVCPKPDGAFYLFVDVHQCYGGQVRNSTELCTYLLDKAHVALVPGAAFGDDNCIRLSYAVADDVLADALSRVGEVLGELAHEARR